MANQDLHNRALQAFEIIKQHLDNHRMRYQVTEDDLRIDLISIGEDLPMPVIIRVQEDRQLVQLISPLPVRMPEDKRLEGAVATTAANYNLVCGNFNYDVRDGEIHYRITTCYHDTMISDEVVGFLMGCTLAVTDHFNDRFYDLAKGKMDLDAFLNADRK